nr:molybdopterin cofactor-binding domain-containing protein [Allorhizobium sonneratiae]
MLIDWLRSPEVGLTGPKKPCGQGGCGGCTVVLSHWDEEEGKPVHLPINSCLRPVAALNGLAVTTIEGTGSVRECMNKVAYRVAKNNGTQCGYCTNGWVMAMTGFLANEPDNRSKKDIEELFDGNLCRCTGYRALLDGMKTFASDWTAEDEAKLMKCYVDPAFAAAAVAEKVEIAFPEGARRPVKPVGYEHDGKRWIEAGSVDEAIALVRGNPRARLVNGNTSFGIYKDEVLEAEVYVDIGAIEDLRGIVLDKGELSIGAGVTYGELLAYLGPNGREGHGVLAMLDYMGRRTAGSLVRNAASLAGNTMLVLHHIHDGEPFPSDLATAFCAADALVDYVLISKGERRQSSLSALMSACAADPHLAGDLFLLRYRVSVERDGVFWAQKTALREVNSHSIVNSGSCITLETAGGQEPKIAFVNLVFGGIAPYAWRPERTISFLQGKKASPDVVAKALHCLTVEVKDELAAWAKRMASVPNEGFTDAYRLELAQSYLYKAVLNALLVVDPALVPEELRSAAVTHWQNWPVSGGSQSYQTSHYMEPLSEPYIKLMAMYQAQGEVKYTHETPVVAGTLFGAMIGAQRAVGTYRFIDPSSGKTVKPEALGEHLKERLGGFSRLVTAADIPEGGSNMAGDASDQPLFLEPGDAIMYAGQSLAMVLGTSERSAEAAADYVAEHCIAYDNHGDSEQPVLSIEDALAKDWIFPDCPQTASWMAHIWKVKRPGTKTDWVLPRTPGDMTVVVREKERDGVFYKVVATGQRVGSQLHFYMETQATVIQPRDDGSITVHSSTQSPKSVQDAVAKALGMPHNEIGVQVRQLGGGFGGKTGPSTFTACMAAIASRASNRPVHMALTRESDSGMIGRRHPYLGQYQLLVDTGATDPATKGLIHGLKGDLWGNGGAFYDCSFIVSDCIQLRVDNAYNIKYYETTIDVCRTNTAPNTAYRAFGDIQGTLILENAIEDAAVALDMDVTELREKNLYKEKDLTPGGQQLDYCYLRDVWKYAKEKSDFEARKRKVEDYNRANKWRKRGISLIPLKYGSGFNLVMLEQTTALLSIYESDGTIIIQQGGVDMGQGMITMLTQIAAYALNVPLSTVRVESSDTRVIPNPSSTGASTGTQYNGTAIKNACTEMKARMEAFVEGIRKIKGDDYCKSKNIDYWNYNNGWQAVPANNNGKTIWQNIVSMAFNERVNLQVQANAKITGGDHKVPNVEFRPYALQPTGTGIAIDSTASFSETVNTYIGFTYNAACAEVEVDILTGETKILRVDLIYDMGKSLNPAIDVGQIEGGFMQGVGYVLSENIVYEDKGESAGVMTTDNTWRYKPPAVSTVPIEMNVMLFPRELAKNVPEDPHLLYSSKEVGEPPLVLANTVFFAVKSAIRASRVERGLSPFFELPAPATVQAVRTAADVTALA